ncbi:hypothetical protein [Clostridium sp.]|uniref:hypothetical protein n=1 Tax=Clostridium sp. TaxID=1506 RepID=UPI001A4521C0|nr:hypothetical protein [Clostridium sp.]MBK5236137.1 hypothetical protein [Clostridium sp.]
MSKPSIFSKHYEKEVKKRRKKIFLLIILPIIGLIIFLFTDFNALFDKGISMKEGINNILVNKSKENTKVEEDKAGEVQKKQEEIVKSQTDTEKSQEVQEDTTLKVKDALKNEIFLVSLSDGQKVSVEYNVNGTEKKITGVKDAKNISYDISPSKKSIVIQSTMNQDILYFDINKTSKDITKKQHTSSRGDVILKDSQLKNNPNYIWSITPKFIDEDNIVYVSELPWMNSKAVQYIWKMNLKNNDQTQVKSASGKKVIFKNITSKGLETIIDGNVVYITTSGEVIK